MTRTEYLRRIREYLHDPEGKVWSTSELAEMLSAAARAYSADTGIYRASFPLAADADGVCELPANYISFLAGWNKKGEPIEPTNMDELSRNYGDFTGLCGDPKYVYEETESIGRIRLCPHPDDGYGVRLVGKWFPYGTPLRSCYGNPIHNRD